MDVYAAGISVEVGAHYPGDLSLCHRLPPSRGVGMGRQKSAEGIVVNPMRLMKA